MSTEHAGTRMGMRRGDALGKRVEPPPPEQVERAEDAVKVLPWEPSKAIRAKVMFMVANSTSAPVNAEVEERAIQDAIDGKRFVFQKVPDVRAEDLFRSMKEEEPHIVHFSGHGTGSDGLAMKNRDGDPTTITARELGLIFKDLAAQGIAVRAVLLNACLAEEQAQAIAPYVDNVVGTSTLVGDDTAVTFAASFYTAIAEGRTVRAAFEAARARCGGDVEGTERIFRLFYSEPEPPLPEPSWKKFALTGVLINILAVAGWFIYGAITSDPAAPDVGPPDAAAAAPPMPLDPDAAPPDAAPPDAAPAPDAAKPDPVKSKPARVVRRSARICARDLKAGRNLVVRSQDCCQGSIPVSPAQKQAVTADLGRCTTVLYCSAISASCR